LTSAGIRQIAQACPRLRLLRLGGSPRSNKVAAEMVPKLIPPPLLQRGSKPAESWEDLPLGKHWVQHLSWLLAACGVNDGRHALADLCPMLSSVLDAASHSNGPGVTRFGLLLLV
jgi:hypothetical protein